MKKKRTLPLLTTVSVIVMTVLLQILWLHMLYAALGAIVFTLVRFI